ncbi:hypothetical protein D8674_010557 [Pyrus ussuriensis x Pyrus communis]|uniref:Uncharacterized protein n=1 Tax=Pyrus ussuriensis x Pyrus communis TaxID=2448454 RepID=A0A5N5FB22_9ROSA|nr:hypothetical protein D8674_010557 [Pyrus ussuriensis x Pyrus communis]
MHDKPYNPSHYGVKCRPYFLTSEWKGTTCPEYVTGISDHFPREHNHFPRSTRDLNKNIINKTRRKNSTSGLSATAAETLQCYPGYTNQDIIGDNSTFRRSFDAIIAQLWENKDLKAFPIFPSGVRYIPGKIRDKATFTIFLQNFSEDKSTQKLACKTDDVFPKRRMIVS